MMDECVPKFNPNVVDGSVDKLLLTLPDYLDSTFHSSIKSLHSNIDMQYLGYRYVSPEREFTKNFATSGNDKSYDLAHSDVYPVQFVFQYKGEEIVRELLLPYASRGNIMKMSGTNYVIAPVLSDTILSPDNDQLFVRLFKDKITFRSYTRNFIRNGQNKGGSIIWAEIMKNNTKTGELGKPLLGISLYLFANYGFKGVVERYFKDDLRKVMSREMVEDDIIFTDKDRQDLLETHNVYESTKTLPTKCKSLTTTYIGHDAKFYIKKDIPETTFITNCIYGVLNGLDTLPHYATELIEHIERGEVENEKFKWKMIIATIACKGKFTVNKKVEDITDHFYSLENYVDSYIIDKFKEINIYIENFFDLLYIILYKYNELILSAKEYNSDIRNRYMDVNYYVAYDIMIGFNKVILSINKRNQKIKKDNSSGAGISNQEFYIKDIKKSEIEKMFHNDLKDKTIFGIIKSSSPNFHIIQAESTNDSMTWKCTMVNEDQSRGKGVKRANNTRFPSSMQIARSYDTVLGSIFYLPKGTPSGRLRTNVFLDYNLNTGRINIDPEEEEMLEYVDMKLKGKTDDQNIIASSLGEDYEDIDMDSLDYEEDISNEENTAEESEEE